MEDQVALLVVVGCTRGSAVAIPPRGPTVLEGRAAVSTEIAALFTAASPVGITRAAAEKVGVVAKVTEEKGSQGREDDDEYNAF